MWDEFVLGIVYILIFGWVIWREKINKPSPPQSFVLKSLDFDPLLLNSDVGALRPWIEFTPLTQDRAFNLVDRALNTYGFQMGINYILTRRPLRGCINDALNIRGLLLANRVPESNLVYYSDFTVKKPTKSNVVNHLRAFLQQVPDYSNILVSFSGHGTRYSLHQETLCLLSENSTSIDLLLDNELFQIVSPTLISKPNTRLFFIADSCFSGNVMNLRYTYYPDRRNTTVLHKLNTQYQSTPSLLFLISGSATNQTSADVESKNSIAHGALTYTMLQFLYENRTIPFTYEDFILGINRKLRANQFTQISCLSCSRPIDLKSEMKFP